MPTFPKKDSLVELVDLGCQLLPWLSVEVAAILGGGILGGGMLRGVVAVTF